MTKVLVVGDEPQMLRALRINLEVRRYRVTTASDGADALHRAADNLPDLLVLDFPLSAADGVDLIRRLRDRTANPIIVLFGRPGSGDKIAALNAGADDYVTKPFGIGELLARMRAAVPLGGDGGSPVQVGRHTIDLAARTVRAAADGDVVLGPDEWRLLELLILNAGRLVSHRQLRTAVPGPQPSLADQLRRDMARLRRKLEVDPTRPRHLLAEPGMGYRFQP
ncbi:two-component system KDP operon response regulator KdpE [Micromonospora pisi]|uniref:Two-component system KDP operon response regulator KdpE n=1 Tax=Micromonospora pisi TaxID=589240 RepID=A0A495JXQ1_9ACTN|nr:response regulator [Micromonospora pisi]RKR93044.1 two-component system KDP operon response regulator KdpE [Micromonospora pisi]